MKDLVEQMLDVDSECGTRGDSWRIYCEEDRKAFRKGMTAAAKVCLDAALGELKAEDFNARSIGNVDAHTFAQVSAVLKIRRARLLAPKAVEEQIADHLRSRLGHASASGVLDINGIARELAVLIAEIKEREG